jgi:hypothetical protein
VKRRAFGRWSIAALLWLAACAAPHDLGAADAVAPTPIEISMQPVALDTRDPKVDRVGKLIFRSGHNLTTSDARFGGWSDLDISDDGTRLTSISDRGFWFDATIQHDENGGIAQLTDARLGYLVNLAGFRQRGLNGDAEGLSRTPDGGFLVSFERRHRIWLYPPAEPPFSVLPRPLPMPADAAKLPMPADAAKMPENGGIETLVRLSGRRVLAISEEMLTKDGANVGWLGDGRTWSDVSYVAGPDFKPTGAARLPNGDILILERRFSRMTVPGARIVRVPAYAIQPGARLIGEELALIGPPMTFDNFEGITTRLGPHGEILLYVISDDNYFFLQRTLLLVFELAPE